MTVYNMKVTHAGYKYIGHFRRGCLEILLETPNSGISVEVKDEFSIYDLFCVFNIDCEDGTYMSDLEGKYCRVLTNESGKVAALQHIVNDKIIWYAKKGDKDGTPQS